MWLKNLLGGLNLIRVNNYKLYSGVNHLGKISAVFALFAVSVVPFGEPGLAEIVPGPIPARIVRVIDGDTIVVRARIWLGQDECRKLLSL